MSMADIGLESYNNLEVKPTKDMETTLTLQFDFAKIISLHCMLELSV